MKPCEVCGDDTATLTTTDSEGEVVEVCPKCDWEYYVWIGSIKETPGND